MALPAANLQTAGKKKPAINAASTAQAGYSRKSEAIMNEVSSQINLDITPAGLARSGGQQ